MSFIPLMRWSLSLGNKFFRVVPWQTTAVVLLTLGSQLSSLIAFFLPLKVVILLGAEGTPRYFPAAWSDVDRDFLIVSLSAATVAFFLLHLLAERAIVWVTGLGTARLLAKSRKVVLFQDQDEIAANAYQRYTRALASGFFIVLSLATMIVLYVEIAAVISLHAVASAILLLGLSHISVKFRERLETRLTQILKLSGGIGFFFAFGFLVVDFIAGTPPGLIVAIVAILLLRQMTNRAVSLVKDLVWLQKQRAKVDALFFHGKVLMPATKAEKTIWPLVAKGARDHVALVVFRELVTGGSQVERCVWHQTGIPDVAGLRFEGDGETYLLKLYGSKRSAQALHEASLMSEPIVGLPTPQFIGTTVVQKFSCLLYRIPCGNYPSVRSLRNVELGVCSRLMSVSLPNDIIRRFERSKPMLSQRLGRQVCDQLSMSASTLRDDEHVAKLESYLDNLQQILRSLPLILVVPDIKEDQLWVPADGSAPLLTHLGRWDIEPLGAGWPVKRIGLSKLESALEEQSSKRPSLADVDPAHAELAALAYALESECKRQRYNQALALVPGINDRLARCCETV